MNTYEYVLVTAAYNEERFIGKTIQSIVEQTHVPKKWVIVSDGSTDRTDEIVRSYTRAHEFIQLHRISEEHPRNFAAQVNAINTGCRLLKDLDFDFIGNVDADVSFEPEYYERLLAKFGEDANLGLAGGYIHEEMNGVFRSRSHNSTDSVAHAVQLFRRACFEVVGGYLPLPYGGPDWAAEITARINGWRVRSFPELPVRHYRPTSSAGGIVRSRYRQGLMDYSLGCLPMFEIVKCLHRIAAHPFVIGSLARLAAFGVSYIVRAPRSVTPEVVQYLREEQRQRLRAMIGLRPEMPKLDP
jgi:glycosyltransferase involved in cell wall biosynthesis